MIRAPICTVVGHVDHGKTTLLDAVRGTAVAAGEAGAITQAIGASIIPIEHIKKRAKTLIGHKELSIPGLLFIDTPGHAAFTSMRKRGGSLADIAILIVDINEGMMPQTIEALEILRAHKTPFVVAANKIDRAPGYNHKMDVVLNDLNAQQPNTVQYLETKMYELVGVLAEHSVPADRFDRIEGFDKQVAIVPISAMKGYGIDSLLAIIVGLAQKFLEQNLDATSDGPAKGTILEVSEDKGLGLTLNAIIYDGSLDVGDEIVIGTLGEPIVTKVRALFQPDNVGDIRDRKTRFKSIKKAIAATGVKISAPGLEGVQAGMPFAEAQGNTDALVEDFKKVIGEVAIHKDNEGVIIKADNIGSLEAIIQLLREKNIPIRGADIGGVSKKDLAQAASNPDEYRCVLAFNVNADYEHETVKILKADIIYKLLEQYDDYVKEVEDEKRAKKLSKIALPARLEVLQNCIFRQSNPLVCGVHVQQGRLRTGSKIISGKDPDESIGVVKEIQERKENIQVAEQDSQVALSIPGAVGGRHVNEGDILWAAISEEDFRKLKEFSKQLSTQEKNVLREFAEHMRKKNPMWGV